LPMPGLPPASPAGAGPAAPSISITTSSTKIVDRQEFLRPSPAGRNEPSAIPASQSQPPPASPNVGGLRMVVPP
jgi:hypothetical protein